MKNAERSRHPLDAGVRQPNNHLGKELKEGMKVTGFITYIRSFGRTGDKTITGTIVKKHGRLVVNSLSEPEKFYSLSKFEHNYITEPEVFYLDIIKAA